MNSWRRSPACATAQAVREPLRWGRQSDGGKAWYRRNTGGIGLGGILVIVGIVLMLVWSFWLGLILALVGLVAFGGFAKGKWY